MTGDATRPLLLIVDDDAEFAADLVALLAGRYRVEAAGDGEAGLERAAALAPDVVLLDLDLGRPPDGLEVLERLRGLEEPPVVIMLTGRGDIDTVVHAVKRGAFHFIVKPPDPGELTHLVERGLEEASLRLSVRARDEEIRRLSGDFVAGDPRTLALLAETDRVAATDATVLITGDCGTGKEMVARRIHAGSARRRAPFVGVNCGAFPPELIESELFGHEKGAFTGAERLRRGKFELAAGGTLFLDEIGEAPEIFQVKLLRVLEERSFFRVGGERSLRADVRLIAATSRDLERAIEQGAFREELYYRLNIVRIRILPLRERPGDILPLARHFLARARVELVKEAASLTPAAEQALLEFEWPGNVRELRNVIERAVIHGRDHVLGVGDLGLVSAATGAPPPYDEAKDEVVRRFKRRYLSDQLDRTGGNVSEAARASGLPRQSLQRMLGECGLDPADFRRDDEEGESRS